MKMLFLSLVFLLGSARAATLQEKLKAKKYHFSAINEILKQGRSESDLASLEQLLLTTGYDVLADYDMATLAGIKAPSSWLLQARKSLAAGDLEGALASTRKVPQNHLLHAEAKLLEADIQARRKNYKSEVKALEECAAEAAGRLKTSEMYFRTLRETCEANKARRYFKLSQHKSALDHFNKFPKNSYKWPYLLFERAWLYYHLKDYNRALGLLVTYKSPLLDTYFFPEAEYLTALSYFRLCLYQDSSLIINKYYQDYRPRFTALEKVLRENKEKKNYFFLMLFKQDGELKEHEAFVRQVVVRMKKQYRFAEGLRQIKLLNEEIKLISTREKKETQAILLPHLRAVRANLVRKLDNYAKLEIFQLLESVRFYSNELFKMNLEIIARKKDMIYDNKKLISDRSRGDNNNVRRSRFEYFWKFEGAFWADELGDYSFGLKSNCETVEREVKP